MSLSIAAASHRLLDAGAFVIRCAQPIRALTTPDAITSLTAPGAQPPHALPAPADHVKAAVRDLLREGGYKPSGRSKPASEYLAAAFEKAAFPRINALVDACNVVSLHSALPISLVDLDRVTPPLALRVAPPGTSYLFNPSGQTIDAGGLLALYDAEGPTATPVKDAQRTKTHDDTTSAVVIVWGTRALAGWTAITTQWYRALVAEIPGVTTEDVALT